VNNNKPGEFVSSSGNFFDLASYFFWPRMRSPGGMRSRQSLDAGLARSELMDADPRDRGCGVETYTEIIVAFQNFATQHSRMWSRHSGT
jgi:hypothetical protein